MPDFYSTGVHRVGYKAERFATGVTVTSYFWGPSLVRSSLQTFTEVEFGAYYLDYDFDKAGTYLCMTFENDVPKGFTVYRIQTVAEASVSEQDKSDIVNGVMRFVQADKIIDTTKTPWQLVWKDKDTGEELLRQTMKTPDDNNITSINTVLGRLESV